MPIDEGVHKNLKVVPSFYSFTRMFSLMPKADLDRSKNGGYQKVTLIHLLEFQVNAWHGLEFVQILLLLQRLRLFFLLFLELSIDALLLLLLSCLSR